MKCPKCGYENREEARFCLECGAKLENVCPQCGARLPPGARFCDGCGAKLPGAQSTTPPRLEDMQKQLQDRIPQSLADKLFAGAKQMQGEYRLVTALFADVSGSSGMARELPLEQYVETINDCFKMMVDTISIKYEGSINRFIGDCVLAFFGAPITHENDAERAILAALDIREAVKALGLDVSIGINTGVTYVGEMGSDLTYSERSAWGPDVDFARRLQEAAGPGQIWVGASTYRLTRRAFDFSKTVEIEAKGTTGSAYPVLHIKEHPEKLRGIEGLRARMIGREREFSDLKEAADGLISGRGSIVTIIGEAGLGKSRLAWELKEYLDKRLETSDIRQEDDAASLKSQVSGLVSILEGRSISIGQTVSYWPFLDILRTYLDLRDTDTEADIARKLREAIVDLFPQGWEDVLPFMGRLLSINLDDDMERKLSYYTPEQIRHQTLMRMRGVLTAISRRKPLLLILEDMHWSDDLSMDLVSLLMDDLAENPLMLLCIYRPERGHRCWQLGDIASRKCLERYTEITLKKLSSAQSRQLVESLLEIENLPEATRDMILRKSEGNPFFIEEVIRYLIDRDLIYREGDRWKARREIEDIDVPDTIQSVLLSRVDRLEAETRYVLQCASVIGRLFRYRLLEHLSRHERDLEEHLSELEERELVIEERTVPELEYSFKHALTQEATYQSILERRRRQFHHRVAEGIESLYRERVEDLCEELAHHYRLSGNEKKTIEYLLKSGVKAANNFANQDALGYLNQAEELLERSTSEHREEKAMLYEKRGEVLQFIGRWMEALKEYEEALKWCDDPHERSELYRKMGEVKESMGDLISAFNYMDLGLNELPDGDRSVQWIRIEYALPWVWEGGQSSRSLGGLQAAKIAEEMEYWSELARIYAGNEFWQSFHESEHYSHEYGQKAIALAEKLGDPATLAQVCYIMGDTRLNRGEHWIQQSTPYFQRAAQISERIGNVAGHAQAWSKLGLAYRKLGQNEEAIESWEQALSIAARTNTIHDPMLLANELMTMYAERGQADMVVASFSRIMQLLASLGIDEISQAWLLLMRSYRNIYTVYRTFRDAYHYMGKESEFPRMARTVMEDLLEGVSIRPQRSWYHTQLMGLCLELGDIASAEDHASKTISMVDEMGRPDYMVKLYPPYLLLGEITVADGMAYRTLVRELHPAYKDFFCSRLEEWLKETELNYRKTGQIEAFKHFCERIEQGWGERSRDARINELFPKPAERLGDFPVLESEDSFSWGDTKAIPQPWEWIDPEGSSAHILRHDTAGIEISASSGTVLGFDPSNAPRLAQQISGNFAIETRMGAETMGGLFIGKGYSELTLQRWPWFAGLVVFVDWSTVIDRGITKAKSLTLRLERKADVVSAYYSAEGQNWYTFIRGKRMHIEDPVQVGIFASCPGDTPKAITSFDYFRIYRG